MLNERLVWGNLFLKRVIGSFVRQACSSASRRDLLGSFLFASITSAATSEGREAAEPPLPGTQLHIEWTGSSAVQTACFTQCKSSPGLRDHRSSRHCEAKRIFEGVKFLFYSIETWQYSTLNVLWLQISFVFELAFSCYYGITSFLDNLLASC